MRLFLIVLLTLLTFSCQQASKDCDKELQAEVNMLLTDLGAMTAELNGLKAQERGMLIHVVYFTLKSGITEQETEELVTALEELRQIPEVKFLKLGDLSDTGDDRAGSTSGIALHMGFESREALDTYQVNDFHLAQREKIGPLFGGPPVVYDYFLK